MSNLELKQEVSTDLSRDYYNAVFEYWAAVREFGADSDEAAYAGMHMAGELVRARNRGATYGELDLLRISARWMANDDR